MTQPGFSDIAARLPKVVAVIAFLLHLAAAPSFAQKDGEPPKAVPEAPRLTMFLMGADRLMQDMEYALSLTTPEEQKQWPILKEHFEEIFLYGIDPTRPVRIDILSGDKLLRYRPSFPLGTGKNSLDEFRENLDTGGITQRRRTRSLYELGNAFEGFMRVRDGYASIAEVDSDVPYNLVDPIIQLKPLIEADYDFAIDGHNDEEGQEARRKIFEENISDEILGSLERRRPADGNPGETEEDFALRKGLIEFQMGETRRYFVEAKHLLLGFKALTAENEEPKGGFFNLLIEPLPATNLGAGFQLFNQEPSHFANIPRSENPILSSRINFPFDDERAANFKMLSGLLRDNALARLKTQENVGESELEAQLKITNLFFDMLDSGIDTKVLDTFAESHPTESGTNSIIGAFRVADSAPILEILKLLPESDPDHKVEMDFDEHGGVKIHRVTLTPEEHEIYREFLGEQPELYIASGDKVVWGAAGPGSLDELKTAIDKVAEPNEGDTEGPFTDVFLKPLDFVKVLDRRMGDEGFAEFREKAIAAFGHGDAELVITLNRDGENLVGELNGTQGILRLVGKMIAQFSKENFDEG